MPAPTDSRYAFLHGVDNSQIRREYFGNFPDRSRRDAVYVLARSDTRRPQAPVRMITRLPALTAALVAAVLLVLPGTSALADPPPVKELRLQAMQAAQDDRLADARDAHLTLWRMTKHPDDAYNV